MILLISSAWSLFFNQPLNKAWKFPDLKFILLIWNYLKPAKLLEFNILFYYNCYYYYFILLNLSFYSVLFYFILYYFIIILFYIILFILLYFISLFHTIILFYFILSQLLLLLLLLLLIFFSRFCFLEISPPYRITTNDLKSAVTLAVFLLFFLYFTPSFFRSILVIPIKHGFCNISAVRSNSSFLIHFLNLFVTITAGNAPHIRSYSGPYLHWILSDTSYLSLFRMGENVGQNNSEYGHILRSVSPILPSLLVKHPIV